MPSEPRFHRAFVAHYKPQIDYVELRLWAREIVPVLTQETYPDTAAERTSEMRDVARAIFHTQPGFNPIHDILAVGGDPLCTAICVYALRSVIDVPVWLAKWDAKQRGWYVVSI